MIRPRAGPLPPVLHGGPTGAAEDGAPPVELDFSTNVNAWGPAPAVLRAVATANLAQYPDPAALRPRRAAARYWGLPEDRVRFTAGAVDPIYRLARTYLARGDTALVAAPAFGEYTRAARGAGAGVIEVRAAEEGDDAPLATLIGRIRTARPRLVFVASPSSPLGVVRADHELQALADAVGDDGLLVLDEAYRSFVLGRFGPPSMPHRDNVVHLRSITKDCALAGIRAAFLVAHPEVLAALDLAAMPWSESTPAQQAATAALAPDALAHLERTLGLLAGERTVLARALGSLGFEVKDSAANYLCVRVPAAANLCTALRNRGIRIRPCASFGLPDHVRIAVRRPDENLRLLRTLEEALC